MAGTTGLEPATSAVTGQRSNQLSYVPKSVFNTSDICHIEASVRSFRYFRLFLPVAAGSIPEMFGYQVDTPNELDATTRLSLPEDGCLWCPQLSPLFGWARGPMVA
jgi:hypothetical protein